MKAMNTCTCGMDFAGYHVANCASLPRPPPPVFPWEYQGGGHWRAKGIPRGQTAETRHGEEIVAEAMAWVRR